MISRDVFTATKVLAGIVLAVVASLNYAIALSYTHPAIVAGAMAICFVLLTLPMWLALAGKPLSNVPAYYLIALVVLVGLTLGRFPVQALLLP